MVTTTIRVVNTSQYRVTLQLRSRCRNCQATLVDQATHIVSSHIVIEVTTTACRVVVPLGVLCGESTYNIDLVLLLNGLLVRESCLTQEVTLVVVTTSCATTILITLCYWHIRWRVVEAFGSGVNIRELRLESDVLRKCQLDIRSESQDCTIVIVDELVSLQVWRVVDRTTIGTVITQGIPSLSWGHHRVEVGNRTSCITRDSGVTLVVVTLRVLSIDTELQPLKYGVVNLQTTAQLLLIRVDYNTLDIVVAQREVNLCRLATASQREEVLLRECLTSHHIEPIGTLTISCWIRITRLPRLPVTSRRRVVGVVVVTIACKLCCIHHIQLTWQLRQRECTLEGNIELVSLSLVGGNEDYTIRTTRTIDRSRRCILQHCYVLNLGWIDIGKVCYCIHHTVDHDKWLV